MSETFNWLLPGLLGAAGIGAIILSIILERHARASPDLVRLVRWGGAIGLALACVLLLVYLLARYSP